MSEYLAPEFRVEVNGQGLAADISKNVVSLQVSSEPNTLDSLSITLANPYPEMRWTHSDDAKLFQEGNAVQVWMGYVDDKQKVFDGEVTGAGCDFPESGTPTVTVQGHTRLHRLQSAQTPLTGADLTDRDIVQKLADAAKLSLEADDPGTTYENTGQAAENDLAVLLRRARAVNYEVWVDGKTLYFKKPRSSDEPACTLVWGRTARNATPGALPLVSFSPTLDARNQVTRVVVRGLDPLTREVITGTASAPTTGMGGKTGPQVAQAAFGAEQEWLVVDRGVTSKAEADQRAQALFDRRAMEFVQGRGTTIGLPGLRAGTVVRLDGLGERFNGNYYVLRCGHGISGGGYRTEITVRRNAVGA